MLETSDLGNKVVVPIRKNQYYHHFLRVNQIKLAPKDLQNRVRGRLSVHTGNGSLVGT